MTTLPTETIYQSALRVTDAWQTQSLARIARLYLSTHYCPAPLTKAEVEQHQARLAELGRLCREMKK